MRHGNKYIKTPSPPKKDLERLYQVETKTQSEIAAVYNVTQKIVFRWFRDLGIKSRVAFKRNQIGENNDSWKVNGVTYAAYHYRVQSARGKADKCEVCGCNEPGTRYEWANLTGNYTDVNDYKMMCCSCHKKHDKIGENFRIKRPNKRKIIDGK